MAFKTYNAKEVVITLGGIPGFAAHTVAGFADGTFVKVSFDEDQFKKHIGADGEVSRSKSNNYSGKIEVTLMQSSDSNDAMSALAIIDRVSSNGVIPVTVADLKGKSLYFASSAWVMKVTDSEFGKELGSRTWTLDTDNLEAFVGGSNKV